MREPHVIFIQMSTDIRRGSSLNSYARKTINDIAFIYKPVLPEPVVTKTLMLFVICTLVGIAVLLTVAVCILLFEKTLVAVLAVILGDVLISSLVNTLVFFLVVVLVVLIVNVLIVSLVNTFGAFLVVVLLVNVLVVSIDTSNMNRRR
jgi:hypothetical protein